MKYFSMFTGVGGFEKGIEQAWYALNAKNQEQFQKVEGSVISALLHTTENGEPGIERNQTRTLESATASDERKSLKPTEANVLAAQSPLLNSLQSTTSITTAQRNEEGLAAEVSIIPSSKRDSPTNINYSATTVTSPGGSMENVPICVGYSEIDRYAIQTYERHFEHVNYGDATKINASELPDFELLVGGFPCQAFSIAGKRAGFNDTRGTLFFDIARILAEKRPRHLVLENVKGLLSHDGGKTLQTIFGVLTDLGYSVEWQVLNSKDFGVPQNRERIYIVGHLGDGSCGQVFPISGGTGADIKYDVRGSQRFRVFNPEGLAPTISTMQGGNTEPKIIAQRGRGLPPVQSIEPRPDSTTNTLTSVQKDNLLAISNSSKREMGFNYKVSPTLMSRDYKDPKIAKVGKLIRRLTPVECERLQGFPDDWTNSVSDTQRYKQCGNAISVPVVEAVIGRLMPCLNNTQ